jgi:hypothetical protein
VLDYVKTQKPTPQHQVQAARRQIITEENIPFIKHNGLTLSLFQSIFGRTIVRTLMRLLNGMSFP